MTKNEVIAKLCELCTKVGNEHFKHEISYDCFCDENMTSFQFDEKIIEFIETAVEEKINEECRMCGGSHGKHFLDCLIWSHNHKII